MWSSIDDDPVRRAVARLRASTKVEALQQRRRV
jgi:hypothetical protein